MGTLADRASRHLGRVSSSCYLPTLPCPTATMLRYRQDYCQISAVPMYSVQNVSALGAISRGLNPCSVLWEQHRRPLELEAWLTPHSSLQIHWAEPISFWINKCKYGNVPMGTELCRTLGRLQLYDHATRLRYEPESTLYPRIYKKSRTQSPFMRRLTYTYFSYL